MNFRERFGKMTCGEMKIHTEQKRTEEDLSKILRKQRELEKRKKLQEEIKKMLQGR